MVPGQKQLGRRDGKFCSELFLQLLVIVFVFVLNVVSFFRELLHEYRYEYLISS